MDGDKAVTATFNEESAPIRYTLTTTLSPTVGGAVTLEPPGAVYAANTVVTLTAVPAEGYTFDGWRGDRVCAGNPVTLTMTRDMSVVAGFDEDAYIVYLPLTIKDD
jgi:uncharacterized repeat protein (TIGR02543 family)